MDMGLGHGGDGHAMPIGQIQIHTDVAAGVDHHCLSFGLAADEVSGLGEVFVVDAFEKHRNLLVDRGGVRMGVKNPRYPVGYFCRFCASRRTVPIPAGWR